MPRQTARMLVEAGIVPKNAIQQLAHYHLVPEGYAKLHGTRPLETGDKEEVDSFVKDLKEAITNDMAEIRETELDHPGGYRGATLEFDIAPFNWYEDVLVDRFGRLILPHRVPWTALTHVDFRDGAGRRAVVRKEPRYEGDRVTSLVVYIESLENTGASDGMVQETDLREDVGG